MGGAAISATLSGKKIDLSMSVSPVECPALLESQRDQGFESIDESIDQCVMMIDLLRACPLASQFVCGCFYLTFKAEFSSRARACAYLCKNSVTSPYVPPTLAERTSSAAPTFCALVNDKVYVNPRRMLKQRALMVDAMYAATPSIDVLDVDEQSASCGQRASH